MFVLLFVGFQSIIILDIFNYIMFEIGSNISTDHFLKLALLMSCIVIFRRIIVHLWIIDLIRLRICYAYLNTHC
jgi:hypothetical protein